MMMNKPNLVMMMMMMMMMMWMTTQAFGHRQQYTDSLYPPLQVVLDKYTTTGTMASVAELLSREDMKSLQVLCRQIILGNSRDRPGQATQLDEISQIQRWVEDQVGVDCDDYYYYYYYYYSSYSYSSSSSYDECNSKRDLVFTVIIRWQ